MEGTSLDIIKQKLEELKKIIPDCFTEEKIDWEKLKVFFDQNIEFKNERYHLSWAGKTNAYRLLQTPTYKTLKPCKEESVDFDNTENVFIEGDNLEVLKVLQKAYFGKIKMIYIDPPYNTGNDFVYKDDFSQTLAEYKKQVGDLDENGNATKAGLFKNTRENGQYHSNWLNMMLPRLFLARTLLRDDGVIFVSIDDNEVHNLRLLMDEIFGEENFRNMLIIRRGIKSVQNQFEKIDRLNYGAEYVLVYTKNSNYKFDQFTIDLDEERQGTWNNHWRGTDRPTMRYEIFGIIPSYGQWRWSRERSLRAIENYINMLKELNKTENELTQEDIDKWWKNKLEEEGEEVDLLRLSKNNKPEHYIPPSYEKTISNLWIDLKPNGGNQFKSIMKKKFFETPKSLDLIKRLINFSFGNRKDGFILDFFAGSGTTAHAVMELNKEDGGNRKWILVQLPEPTDPESEAYKAGYKTIADIARERIRRAAKKIQEEINEEKKKKAGEIQFEEQKETKHDLGFKVFKLDESNFKQWRPFVPENPEQIKEAILKFVDNVKPESTEENMLYELMLKNGKKLTDKVKKKDGYYIINDNELVIMLDKVDKKIIDSIIQLKPQKVIALDKLFNGNDPLKTNTVLQFKDAGIEFRSV
ncbi:MAG: site-specific DNA-methyltransferase [Spirochaetota bacterium]